MYQASCVFEQMHVSLGFFIFPVGVILHVRMTKLKYNNILGTTVHITEEKGGLEYAMRRRGRDMWTMPPASLTGQAKCVHTICARPHYSISIIQYIFVTYHNKGQMCLEPD